MESAMYFLVNSSIKMGPGKLAGQVGHAAIESYIHSPKEILNNWKSTGSAKIVLTIDEKSILNLHSKYPEITHIIRDLGRTQLEPDTLTVMSFNVMKKGTIPELFDIKLHK